MRALIVLAVLGACAAVPFIGDTPEVAFEKARFFSAYRAAQAAAQPKYNYAPQQAYPPKQVYKPAPVQPKWTGPVAATIPAGLPGSTPYLANTPEVAAARGHFFNAYKAQVAATVPLPGSPVYYRDPSPTYKPAPPVQPKWTGPVAATIPASLPGSAPQVADTPEVNAAKHVFFNAYQRQAAAVVPQSPSYRSYH
ncbi:cuticle protein CP1876-like [Panulirus ornatus]|uniref:cuticle protein CP1876-like n=1 Tax=Panulirus ornatus TaxID=150431 RepID=UPI003A875465